MIKNISKMSTKDVMSSFAVVFLWSLSVKGSRAFYLLFHRDPFSLNPSVPGWMRISTDVHASFIWYHFPTPVYHVSSTQFEAERGWNESFCHSRLPEKRKWDDTCGSLADCSSSVPRCVFVVNSVSSERRRRRQHLLTGRGRGMNHYLMRRGLCTRKMRGEASANTHSAAFWSSF